MAYYRINPFGDERADLHAGIVASTIANANRDKKSKSFKPSDFMPQFGANETKPKQSVEEQKALAQLLHEAFKNKSRKPKWHNRPDS